VTGDSIDVSLHVAAIMENVDFFARDGRLHASVRVNFSGTLEERLESASVMFNESGEDNFHLAYIDSRHEVLKNLASTVREYVKTNL